jgi:tRNA(Ile)-lysidine synthase
MPDAGSQLRDHVREALTGFGISATTHSLLIAVSGGPDSVALLNLIVEAGFRAEVAHLDHLTRSGASTDDARFVEALARSLNAPFHLHSEDVATGAIESSMSFEEYARERRYAFFVETARVCGCAAIVTGHHADDQAETVLMRIIRGTSPSGLAGIPGETMRDGVRVIRPLLEVRRRDVIAYLHARDLAYCRDESNEDISFARNRVRHELLPHLAREYNPRIFDAIDRLADLARAEDELVQKLADAFMARCVQKGSIIVRAAFAEGHRALQRRTVAALAINHGVQPDAERIERAIHFVLEAPSNKSFDLGSGVRLSSARDQVSIVLRMVDPPDPREIPLAVPGDTDAFGTRLRVTMLERPPDGPLSAYCTPQRQVVDARALNSDVMVRHRRNGDRIAPLGVGGSRKLKDYLRDVGVPPTERDRILLITAGGEIVWVVGHAVAQAAAVTEKTARLAQIEVVDAEE